MQYNSIVYIVLYTQTFCLDWFWEDPGRLLCCSWGLHPHPTHTHCSQQLCQLLQEQALEERGGLQEAGAGPEEEGDGGAHEGQPSQHPHGPRHTYQVYKLYINFEEQWQKIV